MPSVLQLNMLHWTVHELTLVMDVRRTPLYYISMYHVLTKQKLSYSLYEFSKRNCLEKISVKEIVKIDTRASGLFYSKGRVHFRAISVQKRLISSYDCGKTMSSSRPGIPTGLIGSKCSAHFTKWAKFLVILPVLTCTTHSALQHRQAYAAQTGICNRAHVHWKISNEHSLISRISRNFLAVDLLYLCNTLTEHCHFWLIFQSILLQIVILGVYFHNC